MKPSWEMFCFCNIFDAKKMTWCEMHEFNIVILHQICLPHTYMRKCYISPLLPVTYVHMRKWYISPGCLSHTYIWENGLSHLVACHIRTYKDMLYLTWLPVTYVHIRTCYISPDCPSHTYIWENGMSHLVACHIRTYKDMLYLTWLPVTFVHIRTCYISPGCLSHTYI